MKKIYALTLVFVLSMSVPMTCLASFDANAIISEVESLLTSDTLKDVDFTSEEMRNLMDYVKEKMNSGQLETEEEIREAIHEGEIKFEVELTPEQEDKVISLLQQMKSLGIDGSQLVEKAEDVYEKYGKDIVDHTDEIVKEVVVEAVEETVSTGLDAIFHSIEESIKTFFSTLLKG